jgi:TPR repeat protein
MNNKEEFALMRKPSSAVEKAAPGAKRILSGMVAETLVLGQKVEANALYQKFRINHNLRKYDYARSLLRKAAEMGHTEAMYDCGMDYMSGDGFPVDNKNAFYWLNKAAEKGHADAQIWFGNYYRIGLPFLPQDLPEAYKWFKLASGQKDQDTVWQKRPLRY